MLFAAALLLIQTAPAQACTAMDTGLPPALAAWTTPAQGNLDDLTRPAVLRSFKPEDQAKLDALPPVKTVGDALAVIEKIKTFEAAQTDGMTRVSFRVEKAGRYGIALDQGGWIDVNGADGKSLESVAHGHGPDCSTIRKIVRFDLKRGAYRITLTKLTKPQARLMLVRGD